VAEKLNRKAMTGEATNVLGKLRLPRRGQVYGKRGGGVVEEV